MAYAQTYGIPASGARVAAPAVLPAVVPAVLPAVQPAVLPAVQPVKRPTVVPFAAPRVLLPVTLPRETAGRCREQLKLLLHSPLGVYVAATEITRFGVRVQLNIAPEDMDFAMHTLIATLPAATIGRVTRRNVLPRAR